MWGFRIHFLSNRLNKSARPKIPINTLSLLKPFVIDKKIAIPTDNAPIKLQGFNVFNFSNHLIFKFNNNLTKQIGQSITLVHLVLQTKNFGLSLDYFVRKGKFTFQSFLIGSRSLIILIKYFLH